MDTLAIIKRIELRLAELGMSKAEFYAKSGISSASFSQWRTGVYNPSAKKLARAAKVLGISEDYLLFGTYKKSVTAYSNGIYAYTGGTVQEIEARFASRDPSSFRIVYRGVGVVITVDTDSTASDEQINAVISIYDPDFIASKKAPTVSGERKDVLDEVDIAWYGDYKELDEDQKATVRDMIRVMRERRTKRQE